MKRSELLIALLAAVAVGVVALLSTTGDDGEDDGDDDDEDEDEDEDDCPEFCAKQRQTAG